MFEQETALRNLSVGLRPARAGRRPTLRGSSLVPMISDKRLPGRGAMRHPLGQIGLAQAKVRPAPNVVPRDLGAEPASSSLAYFLFILVDAVLLIRPAEIVPELRGIELYFYAIGACSLVASGDVLMYLIGRPLSTQPLTLWVLGCFVAVLFPHTACGKLYAKGTSGFHFL